LDPFSLLPKFNLTDHNRDRAIVELDLSPLETLGVIISYTDDEEYPLGREK
jgi:hypothetical protein